MDSGGEREPAQQPGSGTLPVPTARARRRGPATRKRLVIELSLLAVIGALLIGAVGAGAASLYRAFYSPTAFVVEYLDLLAEGRAADALELPGVDLDTAALDAAGLPADASDALLRRAALGSITDVSAVAEEPGDDGTTLVTVSYEASGHAASTTYEIERAGSLGVIPTWRFATSPLAALDLAVLGATEFTVNGFALDTRQVSPDGVDADPAEPVSMLVFTPGLYSVSVDTKISTSDGVALLADAPARDVPITVQTEPTELFVQTVQERVDEFLASCTEQQVLQPTGCPFGFVVRNRIVEPPTWSIVQDPEVAIELDGADWVIPDASAVAHIDVPILYLYDGSVVPTSEDVPFVVNGTIDVLDDGSISIRIGGTPAD